MTTFGRIAPAGIRLLGAIGLGMAVVWSAGCLDLTPSQESCDDDSDCFKGWRCSGGTCVAGVVDAASDSGEADTGSSADATDAVDATPTDTAPADTGPVDTTGADTGDTQPEDVDSQSDVSDTGPEIDGADSADVPDGEGSHPISELGPLFWLQADDDYVDSESANRMQHITRWHDRSSGGTDYDFIETNTVGDPPTFEPASETAHAFPVVRFSGKMETLLIDGRESDPVEAEHATIFFVVQNNDADHTGHLLAGCCSGTGTNPPCPSQFRFNGGAQALHARPGQDDTGYPDVTMNYRTDQWQVLTLVLTSVTGSECSPMDPVKHSVAYHQRVSPAGTNTKMGYKCAQMGVKWSFNQIGNQCSTGGQWLQADIAEVVFFDSVLSSPDRRKVEEHLREAYGIGE